MVRILRGGNINNEKYLFKDNDLFISSEYVKEDLYLKKNTLITPAVSSLEQTGKIARIDKDYEDVVVGGFILMLHPFLIDETFSKFYLNVLASEFHRSNCRSITRKSGQAFYNLSRQKLLNLPIVLPPLNEQKRIVKKIEELIPFIETYNKIEEELEDLNTNFPELIKKSILQEAIQGKLVPQDPNDEPASVLLEKIKQEKEQLIKDKKIKRNKNESIIYRENNHFYEKIGKKEPVCIDDEIPFEIPESWEWVRFGSVVNFSMGKTPQRKNPEFWDNSTIPWVSIADMVDGGLIYNTKEKVNDYAISKSFKGKIVPKETLLMSFKLTVGKVSILKINAVHNEAIISINPLIDLDNSFRDYLFYILPLVSQNGDTKTAIKGKTLNSKSLNKLLLPLPSLNEQKRIANKIEELFDKLNI